MPGCSVIGDLTAGQHWCPPPLCDLAELQLHRQLRTTNKHINRPTWRKITTSCTSRRPSFPSSACWAQASVFFRGRSPSFLLTTPALMHADLPVRSPPPAVQDALTCEQRVAPQATALMRSLAPPFVFFCPSLNPQQQDPIQCDTLVQLAQGERK